MSKGVTVMPWYGLAVVIMGLCASAAASDPAVAASGRHGPILAREFQAGASKTRSLCTVTPSSITTGSITTGTVTTGTSIAGTGTASSVTAGTGPVKTAEHVTTLTAGAGPVRALTPSAKPATATIALDIAQDKALAARLSAAIRAALHGRQSSVGMEMQDPQLGITCGLNASRHYDSASAVKATILAALLRERMQQRRALSGSERFLAQEMITQSDNYAASQLWQDVGMSGIRQFLALAKMTQTEPGEDGYWGLTQLTARDEVRLLHILATPNRVLDTASRKYELHLMSGVEADQRWGVSAGAGPAMTVYLKNGWLPRAYDGWRINSIGYISGRRRHYYLAVLTDDNPTMGYGIQTVQSVASAVNRDLYTAPAYTLVSAGRPAQQMLLDRAEARLASGGRSSGSTPRPARLLAGGLAVAVGIFLLLVMLLRWIRSHAQR